jgi:hypothetical protein
VSWGVCRRLQLLPRDAAGKVATLAAFSEWLLGKARLRAGRLDGAAEDQIDPQLAPSLGILVPLGLARSRALAGRLATYDKHRARARSLVLGRLRGRRSTAVEALCRALVEAVPGDGVPWSQEVEAVARLAESMADPAELQATAAKLFADAGRDPEARAAAGLPFGLVVLADRVLLDRAEDEAPLGEAVL